MNSHGVHAKHLQRTLVPAFVTARSVAAHVVRERVDTDAYYQRGDARIRTE